MYKFEDDTPEYADYLQKTRDSFCQEHFEMDFRSVLLKKFSYSGESQNAYNIEKELPPNLKKGFTRFFNDLHEHERKTFRETSCAKHAFITTLSRYGILPDDLKTAEKRYEERLAHWEQVYGSKCRDIGETLSQNRDAVLHAWEVFQAYQ